MAIIVILVAILLAIVAFQFWLLAGRNRKGAAA